MIKKPGCGCGGEDKGGMPPMMGMMKEMMGEMGETFNPMEMCKHMMETVSTTATMAGFATPEVRALFDDWVTQVEGEVLSIVKQKGEVNPWAIAQELKISEDSALYFISKLIRDKKVQVTAIQPIE